jgi:hypothetical protein
VRETPKDPILWLTLARACRTTGDRARHIEALDRAIVADPHCYPAMLEKAQLMEQGGHRRQAARLFLFALKIAPPDEALPREQLDLVVRGRAAVTENARAFETFLRTRLNGVAGGSPSQRFEECLGILTGSRKRFVQEPSLLYIPWLPAIPFYDRSLFPWLEKLESATDVIRKEYLAAASDVAGSFHPYVSHPEGTPVGKWADLNNSPRWNSLHLMREGKRFDDVCTPCPQTMTILESLPILEIENFAPTVLFSVVAPHTRLPPHSSVTNARVVVHLPLIVPKGCGFRVGNIVREWKEGEAWVFDDTLEHEAWNDSDEYRTILMIDIWNPYLSEEERLLVPKLLNGLREYYGG